MSERHCRCNVHTALETQIINKELNGKGKAVYFFLLAKVDVGGRLVQADPEAFKLVLQQIMQSGRPKQEKLPTHLENLLVL